MADDGTWAEAPDLVGEGDGGALEPTDDEGQAQAEAELPEDDPDPGEPAG
jgi:hypothetical protein